MRHVVLAVDPGPVQSGWVLYNCEKSRLEGSGIDDNHDLMGLMDFYSRDIADHLVVELVASYGQAVGRTVYDTCLATGRFIHHWETCIFLNNMEKDITIPFPMGPFEASRHWTLITRTEVRYTLCGNPNVREPVVKIAVKDRFGGPKTCRGTKANPGLLFGITSHMWSALALAVAYSDLRKRPPVFE